MTECIGRENRKKSNYFMEKLDISNNKTFRGYIEQIRYDNNTYPVRVESVSGSNGGYYIARRDEKTDTVEKFKQRIKKTARTTKQLEKTPILGQIRIKIKSLFERKN